MSLFGFLIVRGDMIRACDLFLPKHLRALVQN